MELKGVGNWLSKKYATLPMAFQVAGTDDYAFFRNLLGDKYVLLDEEHLIRCASDQTEDLFFKPDVVLQPSTPQEVSEILRYCNQRKIAVTPRGAGTGLSGGALPVFGGVALDMRRFNKILELDQRNLQVITEPAVITQELQEYVKEHGLMYPPDPASKGSCFIGGNVSENSGGPRAVKYGVVKDYVLNLEVVLPTGEIIWTGANVLKNATGYNLTQLIVGSEGTLGVITKIVLRLISKVQHDLLMLVPFRSAEQACEAVNAIFLAGYIPSALEFMERDAIEWAIMYVEQTAIPLPEDVQAHLLIEVDGNNMERLYAETEAIAEIVQRYDTDEILFADSHEQKQLLWNLRRKVGEAVKRNSIYKEEDTVVPRAELPRLLRVIKEIGKEYGFHSVCYGHAGDGNLHVNIVKQNMSEHDWKHKLPLGIRKLFIEVVKMGGTISGEHGIGLVQKDYLDIAFGQTQMKLMRDIKNIFDPHGILNPGKIFPDSI